MAYTHADGRIINALTPPFPVKMAEACEGGDLISMRAASTAGARLATHTTTATLLTTNAAWCVALEHIAADATGWCALAVEITDPPTIAETDGAVTQGSVVADTSEILEPLYLSGTAGQATSTAPTAAATALCKQYVGYVTAIDKVVLAPGMAIINPAMS